MFLHILLTPYMAELEKHIMAKVYTRSNHIRRLNVKTSFLSIVITPRIGVPLAGNGWRIRARAGIHDDLRANFAYLDCDGARICLSAWTFWGSSAAKRTPSRRVFRKPAHTNREITIFATHTHSGPITLEIFKTFLTEEDLTAAKTTAVFWWTLYPAAPR
jgi:hypothetical protein